MKKMKFSDIKRKEARDNYRKKLLSFGLGTGAVGRVMYYLMENKVPYNYIKTYRDYNEFYSDLN